MHTTIPRPQIPILFFLISLGNMLGVLLAATLPALTGYFHTSKANVQSLMTIYLMGCFFGQIFYAPLANALGRKTTLYIGGALTLVGSVLCVLSIHMHTFSLLLTGRLITALGASCGPILTNVMLSDAFTSTEVKKIFSYITCGFAIIPALGIAVGGMITEYIAWQGCFYFMVLYAAVVLFACIRLPETVTTRELKHLHPLKIASSYLQELKNPSFVLYAILLGCGSIILYVFAAEGPFVAVDVLHMNPNEFGWYNLIPNLGLFLGGWIAARVIVVYPISKGSLLFLIAALAMWLFFYLRLAVAFSLFFFPFLIFFTFPFIFANGQTKALELATHKTYASSVVYTTQYGVMFLTMSTLYLFSPQNICSMPILYSIAGIGLVVLCVLLRWIKPLR